MDYITEHDEHKMKFRRYMNQPLAELLSKVMLDKVYVRGEGAYLYDDESKQYLDFLSNYGAAVLGHNAPEVVASVSRFLHDKRPSMVQPSVLREASELAEKLVGRAPGNISRAIFSNSGAESTELCIKLAKAATGRKKIVTARDSFHGKTTGSLSLTGQECFQEPYHLDLANFLYVEYGDIADLRSTLGAHQGEIAALILEPIQGEGGVKQASKQYFQQAQAACRDAGVVFILDEVQTGLGRAGHFYYSDALELEPDAIALAKGLGGGMVPLGAVLCTEALYSEDVALSHSSTFAGNGFCCAIGNAVVDALTANEDGAITVARQMGSYLKQQLLALAGAYPGVIKDVRGDGLMLGVEFNVGLQSFLSDTGCMLGFLGESGNLLPLLSGYLANVHQIRVAPTLNSKSTLRVQPPLNVTLDQCDEFCRALESAVRCLFEGDTYQLLRYLLTSGGEDYTVPVESREKYKFVAEPEDGDGRFAFLIHPLTLRSFGDIDASLKGLSPVDSRELVDLMTGELRPAVCGTTRVISADGRAAYGEFIGVPLLPEQLLEMPSEEAIDYIREAVLLARERGAKIVGLGGYTSIASKAGTRVANLDVAVTTGNNYTVLSAIDAVEMACERFDVASGTSHAAIVGAGGSIGSTIAREVALSFNRVTLIGNPNNIEKNRQRFASIVENICELLSEDSDYARNRKAGSVAEKLKELAVANPPGALAARIIDGDYPELGIGWDTDCSVALVDADVVFVSTNSTGTLVEPHDLKRNAIVCDLSRPSNVSQAISLNRPDVFFIDGGVIRTPNNTDLGVNFGFPKGLCFACMAETMMLALDQRYKNTSLGVRLKHEDQAYFREKERQYGFRLAGFRSFDVPVTEAAMERTRVARQLALEARSSVDGFANYQNINAFLFERNIAAGRGTAFFSNESVSYKEAYQRVRQIASHYARAAVRPGDSVAVICQESVASICSIFACFEIGAVCFIVNPSFNRHDLVNLLNGSDISLVVHDEPLPDGVVVPSLRLEELERAPVPTALPPRRCCEEGWPALVVLTSGATGAPKMVRHTHGDMYNTFYNYGRGVLRLDETKRLFSISKSFFVYGFNSVHMGLASGGGVILAPNKATPKEILEKISRFRPTHVFSVPTVYLRLIDEPVGSPIIRSVELFVSAGEPLPKSLYDSWKARFDRTILDGLGTSETMCTIVSNYPEDVRPGSTGRPVPGFQIKLLNEKGEPARVGELGVLWVKGNTVIKEYLGGNSNGSGQAYFIDGWYNTNDVFYRDDFGWYYFQGRSNDMVKVNGEWLSPCRLEDTLRAHPAVKEVAVTLCNQVGLLNRPLAYVVPHDEGGDREAIVRSLRDYCRSKLTRNQYPHLIELVSELPKTDTGKLKRYMLKIRQSQQGKGYESLERELAGSA